MWHWVKSVISDCYDLLLLLLQLYTVDHFMRTLVTVGYATLNVFVESETEKQPIADTGVQVYRLSLPLC